MSAFSLSAAVIKQRECLFFYLFLQVFLFLFLLVFVSETETDANTDTDCPSLCLSPRPVSLSLCLCIVCVLFPSAFHLLVPGSCGDPTLAATVDLSVSDLLCGVLQTTSVHYRYDARSDLVDRSVALSPRLS